MTAEPTPSRAGVVLTTVAGLLGAASMLLWGVWVGLIGVVLAVAGVARCSRRVLGAGVLALFLGIAVASVVEAPYWLLVPAMAGTVLTWDVGENAIGVAEQFPDTSVTWRGETLHATLSGIVVTVFCVAAAVVYTLSVGGYPIAATVVLVLGSLIVLYGLGR